MRASVRACVRARACARVCVCVCVCVCESSYLSGLVLSVALFPVDIASLSLSPVWVGVVRGNSVSVSGNVNPERPPR